MKKLNRNLFAAGLILSLAACAGDKKSESNSQQAEQPSMKSEVVDQLGSDLEAKGWSEDQIERVQQGAESKSKTTALGLTQDQEVTDEELMFEEEVFSDIGEGA